MQVTEILAAFKYYDGTYKRSAVEAAIANQQEIVPHLIEILMALRDDPGPFFDEENRVDHIYAAILLAYFKAVEAHEAIVDVFSMPDEIPSDLFSDVITEDLPWILFQTCGGSLEKIKSLVLNRAAYEFCRWSAADAMVYAVLEGIAEREAVLDFFATLFTGQEAEEDSCFWEGITACMHDLYPEEVMPTILKAFEEERIDGSFLDLEGFEEVLAEGKESVLARTRAEKDRYLNQDIHQKLSTWASDEPFFLPNSEPPKASVKKQKTKKKRKRKAAKASRRKNRR